MNSRPKAYYYQMLNARKLTLSVFRRGTTKATAAPHQGQEYTLGSVPEGPLAKDKRTLPPCRVPSPSGQFLFVCLTLCCEAVCLTLFLFFFFFHFAAFLAIPRKVDAFAAALADAFIDGTELASGHVGNALLVLKYVLDRLLKQAGATLPGFDVDQLHALEQMSTKLKDAAQIAMANPDSAQVSVNWFCFTSRGAAYVQQTLQTSIVGCLAILPLRRR